MPFLIYFSVIITQCTAGTLVPWIIIIIIIRHAPSVRSSACCQ